MKQPCNHQNLEWTWLVLHNTQKMVSQIFSVNKPSSDTTRERASLHFEPYLTSVAQISRKVLLNEVHCMVDLLHLRPAEAFHSLPSASQNIYFFYKRGKQKFQIMTMFALFCDIFQAWLQLSPVVISCLRTLGKTEFHTTYRINILPNVFTMWL